MKTACYRYKGPGRVAISRGTRRMAAGFKRYPALAPTAEMFANGYTAAEFNRRVLGQLNPKEVWEELHSLADAAEPVLVCYEAAGEFCHRHLVARWFEKHLGVRIMEVL